MSACTTWGKRPNGWRGFGDLIGRVTFDRLRVASPTVLRRVQRPSLRQTMLPLARRGDLEVPPLLAQ